MGKTKEDIKRNKNNHEEQPDGISLENIKYSFDNINAWINNADNKISISCALFTGILTAVAFVAENILSGLNVPQGFSPLSNGWMIATLVIAVVSFLVAICFYTIALKPNLIGKQFKDRFSLFYAEIAEFKDAKAYIRATENASTSDFMNALSEEVYYNSKVCKRKMIRLQVGIIASSVAVIATVVFSVGYYILVTQA